MPTPTTEEPRDPNLPLSTEAYKAEMRRRVDAKKQREAEENADEIRGRCQSLHEFVKEAWSLLEPETPFSDNWHIKLICAHLEAVTLGAITRLLINVWPGSMKSLIVSVLWPAWEWGPKGRRGLRYLSTAFNEDPTTRDTRKTRDLILSGWYQTLWPEVKLKRWGETSFANSGTGSREGIPFTSLTSQRGDRLIIDDPHSTEGAESDTQRATTVRKFREGAINRLNDQRKSAIIVIMQRLHMDDLSGTIMRHYPDFVHVVLPMEFEPARAYQSRWGNDPRTVDGELADPKRFPPKAIAELKQSGEYFWNGQYQQRPAPREGGLFKVGKITIIEADKVPAGGKTVSGWDFAASTKKKSPYSVRVRMTKVQGAIYVRHVERRHTDPLQLETMINEMLEDDGHGGVHSFPQDPGQAGKGQKWRIADLASGYDFIITPETGDKELRARPFAAQVGAGVVFLVRGEWNDAYVDELRNFPTGSFKDQVDASSRAYAELIKFVEEEVDSEPIIIDIQDEANRRDRLVTSGKYDNIDPWAAD